MPTLPARTSLPSSPVALASMLACWLALLLAWTPAAGAAPVATLDQVEALLHDGHLNQADHAVAQVLAAQPDSVLAHYVDARVLAAEGKWPLAEDELQRARRLDPSLDFAPAAQVQALAQEVIGHRWKNPSGFAGYGQAALAALFLLVSGYLVFGMLRGRRPPPKS